MEHMDLPAKQILWENINEDGSNRSMLNRRLSQNGHDLPAVHPELVNQRVLAFLQASRP